MVGVAVAGQRPQPGPVGAQRVGQHVGVEPVVLVAGRAVAAAQVLDLVRGDHEHRRARPRAARRPPGRRVVRSPPRATPARRSRRTSWRSPGAVWVTVNRSSWTPRSSTIATAWSVLAQSMPAVGRAGPTGRSVPSCVVLVDHDGVLLAVAAAGGHPNGSGHDCRSLTDRRSGGAQPCRQSACPGPLGLAELMQDLNRSCGRGDDPTGTRDAPATSSSPTPASARSRSPTDRPSRSERMSGMPWHPVGRTRTRALGSASLL